MCLASYLKLPPNQNFPTMKKLLFTAAFMLTLSGAAFAQSGSDLDARVASTTRDMSVKLGLNEFEYVKLKNINREKMAKADEISNTFKNDAAMRDQKLAELQNNYDNQLRSFLNNKQMEAYASYKESTGNYTALEGDKK